MALLESEKDTEKYLIKKVEEVGGLCRKYISPGIRGVPDRLCFMPEGKLIVVEVKSEGEQPELHQAREHQRMKDRGFTVYVVDSKHSVDKVLKGGAR